jgi:elongation factor P
MQTVLPADFKRGMALLIEGVPQLIEDFHVSGTAQTKHKLHVRLRNLKSGRFTERVFGDNERVTTVPLQARKVVFSFRDSDTFAFLDAETYDEFDLGAEQIGERHWFIKEDEEYKALLLDGKLLDIVLPSSVALKVTETAPAHRGGTDGAWKEGTLETGLEIMLPLFIDKGEAVRVDTQTRKYVGKE